MIDSPSLSIGEKELAIVSEILRKIVPGCEVWAFGSRVRGEAKPYSDLDLAIVSDQPLSLARLAELREAFSDSDLPWKVDLVDWASADPEFRKIIEREKVVIAGP